MPNEVALRERQLLAENCQIFSGVWDCITRSISSCPVAMSILNGALSELLTTRTRPSSPFSLIPASTLTTLACDIGAVPSTSAHWTKCGPEPMNDEVSDADSSHSSRHNNSLDVTANGDSSSLQAKAWSRSCAHRQIGNTSNHLPTVTSSTAKLIASLLLSRSAAKQYSEWSA